MVYYTPRETSPRRGQSHDLGPDFSEDLDPSRVVRLEYYTGLARLGEASGPGFEFSWRPAEVGSHLLSCRAVLDDGVVVHSPEIAVTVANAAANQLPTVKITGPAEGERIRQNDGIFIQVDANDADGPVVRVDFFLNGVLIGGDDSAPYFWEESEPAIGDYRLVARAEDDAGAVAESSAIRFSVIPSNRPPIVELLEPTEGLYDLSKPVPFVARVVDPDGQLEIVEFLDGTNFLTVFTDDLDREIFRFDWEGVTEGIYDPVVTATDNDGDTTTRSFGPFEFKAPNQSPEVAILRQRVTIRNPGPHAICDVSLHIDVDADGKILIAGHFNRVQGVDRVGLARLHGDGRLDESFSADIASRLLGVVQHVVRVEALDDGRILAAGRFQGGAVGGAWSVVRLLPNGAVDPSFLPDESGDGFFTDFAIQASGKIVLVGKMTDIHGSSRDYIVRLHDDGFIDPSFRMPRIEGEDFTTVNSVELQPSGKILIGGSFTHIDGIEVGNIARLLPNGELDLSFMAGFGAAGSGPGDTVRIAAIRQKANGKLLVGGRFTSWDGTPARHLVRLFPDGRLDPGFTAAIDRGEGFLPLWTLEPQGDHAVFVGGDMQGVDGDSKGSLALLIDHELTRFVDIELDASSRQVRLMLQTRRNHDGTVERTEDLKAESWLPVKRILGDDWTLPILDDLPETGRRFYRFRQDP